jgi:hypothetical protein
MMDPEAIRSRLQRAMAKAIIDSLNAGGSVEAMHAAGLVAIEIESITLSREIAKEARQGPSRSPPGLRGQDSTDGPPRAPEGS